MIAFISVKEAADHLGLSPRCIRAQCSAGRIQGAQRVGRSWWIPSPVVYMRNRAGRPVAEMPDGYITAVEAASRIEVDVSSVHRQCRNGALPGAKLVSRSWQIPIQAILDRKPEGYVNAQEAGHLLGLDIKYVQELCRTGRIQGAKVVGKSWQIPVPVVYDRRKAGRPAKTEVGDAV